MLLSQRCQGAQLQRNGLRNQHLLHLRASRAPCRRTQQRAGLELLQLSKVRAAADANAAGFTSIDYEQLVPVSMEKCPHGYVEGVMRTAETVLTAKTNERLEDLIPKLNRVSGLPVVDANNRVIGVISRKDIIRVRRAEGSLRDIVADHMTAPAMTVGPKVAVRKAAEMMLKHEIRRLPVVDGSGRAIGLLSRSDIFKPLFKEDYEEWQQKEKEAMATGSGVTATWDVKYLYDGDCAMCRSLKAVLERQDNRKGLISFIDISGVHSGLASQLSSVVVMICNGLCTPWWPMCTSTGAISSEGRSSKLSVCVKRIF
eukprot:GHUV01015914.1.p1 GENE.GHUV01015914.1~~GHUV01015914.1.p1  ORF type:complete len:314 (+),score=70.34 GHUV01015914.1:181-1122(+)